MPFNVNIASFSVTPKKLRSARKFEPWINNEWMSTPWWWRPAETCPQTIPPGVFPFFGVSRTRFLCSAWLANKLQQWNFPSSPRSHVFKFVVWSRLSRFFSPIFVRLGRFKSKPQLSGFFSEESGWATSGFRKRKQRWSLFKLFYPYFYLSVLQSTSFALTPDESSPRYHPFLIPPKRSSTNFCWQTSFWLVWSITSLLVTFDSHCSKIIRWREKQMEFC